MGTDGSDASTSEIGAEILMFVATTFMMAAALTSVVGIIPGFKFNYKLDMNMYLSTGLKLFLPLLSYMDLQAEQHQAYERSQVILVWTVSAELFQMSISFEHPWELWDSIEQCIRLAWAAYLVYVSNGPLHEIRITLLVICSVAFMYEIFQGVTLYLTRNSLRLGKNPQLVDLYMKKISEESEPEAPTMTAAMHSCKYLVFGEETQKIAFCQNKHIIDEGTSRLDSLITIGQVYQPKPDDEVFTSRHPHWRETCVSFAFAKILRQRFLQLPLPEAGNKKALEFVITGLLGADHDNNDPTNDKISDEIAQSVFHIIQAELHYLLDLLRTKVFTCYLYISPYCIFVLAISVANINIIRSTNARDLHRSKQFKGKGLFDLSASAVITEVDAGITILLVLSCICLHLKWVVMYVISWKSLGTFRSYLDNPTKWDCVSKKAWYSCSISYVVTQIVRVFRVNDDRIQDLVFDINYSSLIDKSRAFTVLSAIINHFIRNSNLVQFLCAISNQSIVVPPSKFDVQKALLRSFKMNRGIINNGRFSLRTHGVTEQLSWACHPSQSSTETILVWHIATTLFYDHNPPLKPLDSDPKVASTLSGYCEYLLKYHPELLPDVADWSKSLYKGVKEELRRAKHSWYKSRSEFSRFIRGKTWNDDSVIGKGVRLVKDLEGIAGTQDHKKVWGILADFWAELMLYIAPSDNVEGHRAVLERGELITQLWALLTHAGIIARPEIPEGSSAV